MGLKAFLALGLGILSLSDAALAGRADRQSRANIVYNIADGLGYGDVQCLIPQRSKIKTVKTEFKKPRRNAK